MTWHYINFIQISTNKQIKIITKTLLNIKNLACSHHNTTHQKSLLQKRNKNNKNNEKTTIQ